ncbi:MAG: manganese efflux pump MntP family protein [Clostridiaceae bacterium]|nr:manganese efflux pump MntP family protein [Clostridiaceae bacterium]
MTLLTLILLGLSLSMDTLAVAVATGICKGDIQLRHAIKAGLVFALFQALMPAIGWFAGTRIIGLIQPFDHWLAFALLALIGGKMIYETLHETTLSDDDASGDSAPACPKDDPTALGRLIVLALATSVDALAAGISLAVDKTPIAFAVGVIGGITFVVAAAGMLLGKRLGVLFQRKACLAGGCVLILLGVKILIEHMANL